MNGQLFNCRPPPAQNTAAGPSSLTGEPNRDSRPTWELALGSEPQKRCAQADTAHARTLEQPASHAQGPKGERVGTPPDTPQTDIIGLRGPGADDANRRADW